MRSLHPRKYVLPLILLVLGFACGYTLLGRVPTGQAAEAPLLGLQGYCGDSYCDPATENRQNCSRDCGDPNNDDPKPSGGCDNDGICEPPEEQTFNCGDCPSVCGDNICAPHEVDSCCGEGNDCTVAVTCGDGICSACENRQNCEADCSQPTAVPVRPSQTPTDTATPEEEETQETDEPTEEATEPASVEEAPATSTPVTLASEKPPPDEDCEEFAGIKFCGVSFTFFGVTIVCCVSAFGGFIGTAYAASKGNGPLAKVWPGSGGTSSSSPPGGSTGAGGSSGGGAPGGGGSPGGGSAPGGGSPSAGDPASVGDPFMPDPPQDPGLPAVGDPFKGDAGQPDTPGGASDPIEPDAPGGMDQTLVEDLGPAPGVIGGIIPPEDDDDEDNGGYSDGPIIVDDDDD